MFIDDILVPLNTELSNVVIRGGNVMDFKLEHPLNAPPPIVRIVFGRFIFDRFVHSLKAESSIFVTEFGISI